MNEKIWIPPDPHPHLVHVVIERPQPKLSKKGEFHCFQNHFNKQLMVTIIFDGKNVNVHIRPSTYVP